MELNDVYLELRSANLFFKASGYFSDESEFIVALESTVFPFVKQYIEDSMAAECCDDPTFRAHFLNSRKRSV